MINFLFTVHEKIVSRFKVFILKLLGASINGRLGLKYDVDVFRLSYRMKFGNRVNLDRGVSLILSKTEQNKESGFLLTIGDQVYINRYTVIDATTFISIGNKTMIGPHCYITDHDHDFKGFPVEKSIGDLPLNGQATVIGQNVWLGSHVVVLKGIHIGDNSIIGAGSVITKNIPENVIAVGNPCKVIKQRQ